MTDFFFRIDKLTVGYDGVPLIRDIEVQLKRGQILTLIGPNGSGKSTILKTIIKQLRMLGGTVTIGGSDLGRMTDKELSTKAAVVLTERLKTELMTCEDVVATGRYPYTGMFGALSDEDHRQVRLAMERTGAWPLRDADFMRISDGQRQRILLARAICQQPRIIVLDEPTSFLDVRYALELLEVLRSMADEQGITIIMSLHQLDMAQKVSDVVMAVKGETIAHIGSPEDIFRSEIVDELYDLKDARYNPLFGSFEMKGPDAEPKVFVIAGGGSGVMQYRALQRKRIPFATGVLHDNDVDYQIARDLASEVFVEKGFCPIGDDVYERALARMMRCEQVINCLTRYGEINRKNKTLLEAAASMGILIVERIEG